MTARINYEDEIVVYVRKIMRAIDIHSSKIARLHGLTTPQIICLKKLIEQNGTMTPGFLAKAVNLSHATVTGIINRLEKKGLVKRSRSPLDGRSFVLHVTESGLSISKSVPYLLQEHFLLELSKLANWEKTQILSSLQRIASILSVGSIAATPVLLEARGDATAENTTGFPGTTSGQKRRRKKADRSASTP